MNILMIASECVPYAKTGGLADVVGALPKALQALGHEVIVVMPKYALIDYIRYGLRPFLSPLGVWMGNTEEWCSVHTADHDGVPVYFIEADKYFDRWGLYHDSDNHDYQDNPRRFGLLSRAGLQLCHDIRLYPGYCPRSRLAHCPGSCLSKDLALERSAVGPGSQCLDHP